MSAHSRRKGADAEREVAALAREYGFPKAERSAPMQAAAGDERHPDVANVGRLFVEVKRRGKGSMYALAVEATKERPGYIPTLAYREDRGPWLAVVPLAELLKLERAALRINALAPVALCEEDARACRDALAARNLLPWYELPAPVDAGSRPDLTDVVRAAHSAQGDDP